MNETSLQFHIEKSDYFGTLATVLDLVRQDLDRRGYNPHAGALSRLRDDLVYLQARYLIRKRKRTHRPRHVVEWPTAPRRQRRTHGTS